MAVAGKPDTIHPRRCCSCNGGDEDDGDDEPSALAASPDAGALASGMAAADGATAGSPALRCLRTAGD